MAKPGDYVVAEQKGLIAVLIIRDIDKQLLILEEIDVPLNQQPSQLNWKEWVYQGAPGHTAWISYLIDLNKGSLLKSYSHTKESWLSLTGSFNFLPDLLNLSLSPLLPEDRKKIGPPPTDSEPDRRSLWVPPMTFEGQKVRNFPLKVFYTYWPKDDSPLTGCKIELYFSQFFFPYWIDISLPHYRFNIRILDSGQDLQSPKPLIFKSQAYFLNPPKT